jgi:hypothetical protein
MHSLWEHTLGFTKHLVSAQPRKAVKPPSFSHSKPQNILGFMYFTLLELFRINYEQYPMSPLHSNIISKVRHTLLLSFLTSTHSHSQEDILSEYHLQRSGLY